jgi:hypothetical protein
MILKEKLVNVIFDNLWDHKESNIVPEVEKVADDFAIGFVKFINETDSYHHGEDAFHFDGKWHTYEEFLQIYKKENQLCG